MFDVAAVSRLLRYYLSEQPEPAPVRFSQLRRMVITILDEDISKQILSEKLHALERDGFVCRTDLGGGARTGRHDELGSDNAVGRGAFLDPARQRIDGIMLGIVNHSRSL